jgi:hypothetical protein
MDLYICLQDGKPVEHPIFGENFRQAFPHIDINNLPNEFARFVRVVPPEIGVYEIYEGVTYERNGDVFTDVHHVRPMNSYEKSQKQEATKAAWAENGFPSWQFVEETCSFVAPIPYPFDGSLYKWNESTLSWEK